MLQAEDGFIWVATGGGLSRFDGFRFTNYNRSNGLLSTYVSCLLEHNGVLWAACQGGLVTIDGDSLHAYPFDSAYANTTIVDMASGTQAGELHLITNDRRLITFKNGRIENVVTVPLPQTTLRSIEIFEDRLMLGTKDGLFEWKNETLIPILENASISSIHQYNGELWATSFNKGVFRSRSHAQRWDTINVNRGLKSNHTRDLAFDSLGNCWIIGKYQMFLYHPVNNSIKRIYPLNDEIENSPRQVICDHEGNFWLGTDGAGIAKYTGPDFEIFTTEDGLVSDLVMNIVQREDSSLWFATFGKGVMTYQNGVWGHYSYADNLMNNTVWCLLETPEGVWIGTSDGINIWEESSEKIRSFEFNDQLPFSRVSALFRADNGDIWIGTRDGIAVYDGEQLFTPNALKNVKIQGVKAFLQQASKVYFTSLNGLFCYDLTSGLLNQFSEEEGLPDKIVNCLSVDPLGNIWMGSSNGIAMLNPETKQIRSYQVSHNFSSNIVSFILADKSNMLWAGTDNGLFKMDLQTLYASDSVSWVSCGEHQGVISSECNQNAIFEDIEGNIWFGTNNGFFKFNGSGSRNQNNAVVPVYISRLELNYEPIKRNKRSNSSGALEFRANENRLTFYYSAVHFTSPQSTQYSYRLLGSGDEWSPPASEDHVTFSNMSPGTYIFEVRAKILGGAWGNPVRSQEIRINPPFWLSWWFIGLVLVFMGFIGYQVHLFRDKQRKRKKVINELENKAKILGLEQQTLNAHMNRHFIFNALNSIQYYINTQDRKSANMYLTNFAHLVRKNLDSAQVDMIYLKDELDRLKLYLKLEQMRFSDRFVYELNVDTTIDQETIKVPSMILQPFVENSIMHGILPLERKGNILIQIKRTDEGLEFTIRDNGIGITQSAKQKKGTSQHVSNGMRITRQRMDLLRKVTGKNYSVIGPFELQDSVGGAIIGTEVRIILPEAPVMMAPLVMN